MGGRKVAVLLGRKRATVSGGGKCNAAIRKRC